MAGNLEIWRETTEVIEVESKVEENPSSRYFGMIKISKLPLGSLSTVTYLDIIKARKILEDKGWILKEEK